MLHNSLFLVAHFHNVIIGGVLFGSFAGYNYWFPKAFGFTLDRRLGIASFWCWFIGFWLAFAPLYILGLMGATRRMQSYADAGWQPLMIVALVGALCHPRRNRVDGSATLGQRAHPGSTTRSDR